jgi:DUF438 domain-containing protein
MGIDLDTALAIIDAIPHRVVFADRDHIIRHLNKKAEDHHYVKRGRDCLLGKSLLDCHNPKSRRRIEEILARFLGGGGEEFEGINPDNMRVFMTPVRDAQGALIGYYERHEPNGPAWPATGDPGAEDRTANP